VQQCRDAALFPNYFGQTCGSCKQTQFMSLQFCLSTRYRQYLHYS